MPGLWIEDDGMHSIHVANKSGNLQCILNALTVNCADDLTSSTALQRNVPSTIRNDHEQSLLHSATTLLQGVYQCAQG